MGRAKYTGGKRPRVAPPRNFARALVYFARPIIAIAKIRDYSQSFPPLEERDTAAPAVWIDEAA